MSMKPVPITAAGYNPLSLSSDDRILDVTDEFKNFDFVMFSGTCRQHRSGGLPPRHCSGAVLLSEGYVNSSYSNKSCGTSILVGKRFAKARIFPVNAAKNVISNKS